MRTSPRCPPHHVILAIAFLCASATAAAEKVTVIELDKLFLPGVTNVVD